MKNKKIVGLFLLSIGTGALADDKKEDLAKILTANQPLKQTFILQKLDPLNNQAKRDLVPAIAAALTDPSVQVRTNAAIALKLIGPFSVDAIPELVEALKNKKDPVANQYIKALSSLGSDAVPSLLAIQKNKSRRALVFEVLRKMGPAAKESIPILKKNLRSSNGTFRLEAARALTKIDPTTSEQTVPVFRKSLQSSQRRLVLAAIETLGLLGEKAKPAVPDLLAAVEKPSLAAQSAQALVQIDPENPAIPTALLPLLQERKNEGVAMALVRLGNPILPTLETWATEENENLRSNINFILKNIGTKESFSLEDKLRNAISIENPQ